MLAKAAIDASSVILQKSATCSDAEGEVLAHLTATEGMSKKASLALLLATGDAVIQADS